jgi:uncharacterized protein (DUF952 family)
VRTTFHLAPLEVWSEERGDAPYVATSLATEGFIHCTDGVEAMVATANRFYASDPRPFVVLTIDLDALDVPWRYDEPGSPFPHVYGPIELDAIVSATRVPRDADGRFLPFEA